MCVHILAVPARAAIGNFVVVVVVVVVLVVFAVVFAAVVIK